MNRLVLDEMSSRCNNSLGFSLTSAALLACGFSVVESSALADRTIKAGCKREEERSVGPEI